MSNQGRDQEQKATAKPKFAEMVLFCCDKLPAKRHRQILDMMTHRNDVVELWRSAERYLDAGQEHDARLAEIANRFNSEPSKQSKVVQLRKPDIISRPAGGHDEITEFDLEILPLAANSASDSYVLSGENYDVVIEHRDDDDCPWMVSLQLKEPIRSMLSGRHVRLLDRGGHEWVTAPIDETGEINFGWYDNNLSPVERAIECGVRIEVV